MTKNNPLLKDTPSRVLFGMTKNNPVLNTRSNLRNMEYNMNLLESINFAMCRPGQGGFMICFVQSHFTHVAMLILSILTTIENERQCHTLQSTDTYLKFYVFILFKFSWLIVSKQKTTLSIVFLA